MTDVARALTYEETYGPVPSLYAPSDISGHTLGQVHDAYRRWFGDQYDIGALNAVLATAAANQLGGDPCWLLLVGGSGATKTETIAPLAGAGAIVVSTISGEAALLSGTSKKEVAADAHGGLLRRIGDSGIIVIKDVTTILSMQRDTRAAILAALREVYDGRWHRDVGTDGGRTLKWSGRLVVIGAVTTAWDSAHAVIATMGDRFVLVRTDSTDTKHRRSAGLKALANVNHETKMREELSAHVGALLGGIKAEGHALTADEMDDILNVADVVTLARTAVERDYQGEVVMAHAPEMPTRFAKQLAQVTRGGLALGMDRADALEVAIRCAGDSMPPLRLKALVDVTAHPDSATGDVVKRLQLPRKTVDRCLQELHLLGLLTVDARPRGQGTQWIYSIDSGVDATALKALEGARPKRPEMSEGEWRK